MKCPQCGNMRDFVEVFTGTVTRSIESYVDGRREERWRFTDVDFETQEDVVLNCAQCQFQFPREQAAEFLERVEE